MATENNAEFHKHQVYQNWREIPFVQTQVIGIGAVGVVDEVEGTSGVYEGRIYARKQITLSTKPQDRDIEIRAIEKEVNALKRLQHTHIVRLITTYLNRNSYAIVLCPRADGNLEQYLQTTESPDKIPKWFQCLLGGVAYAHERGIRHRDLKPHNVLVDGANILLTDFGISMMGLGKTVPTTMVGAARSRSREYCAPEVETGHTRGRSADIFSLGAMFLEMLTVCASPGKLEDLRKTLEVQGRQSYALSLGMVSQWMSTLSLALGSALWHTTMLDLCRKMLQERRELRPGIDDLCTWWLHQPSLDLPPGECHCSLTFTKVEEYGDKGIDESLRYAYVNGHRLLADMWLKRGAKLTSNESLIAASEGGMWDHVGSLIKEGADAKTSGALQKASAGGFKKTVRILLANGADIEAKGDDGRTPLHSAASEGHKMVVAMLLENGADAEMKDNNSKTAAQLATIKGYGEVVKSLLDHTAGKKSIK